MTAPASEMRARLESLDDSLSGVDVDACIVTHGPSVRYLTGFTGSSGFAFHRCGAGTTLITDFRYEEQAALETPAHVSVHISREGWVAALGDICEGMPALSVAFEPEHLTVLERDRLAETLEHFWFQGEKGLVSALRAVKSAAEIASIRKAADVARSALEALLTSVDWRAGATEVEVAVALESELRRAGSEGLPFEVIVASGDRTSLPHARPGERRIAEGDLLLIDFGAIVDGYCCDISRTFSIGDPADWQVEVHGRVLEAQEAALAAVGPGVLAADVDGAARDALASHDLAEYFGHSTGHGIGLEIHEDPRVSARSVDVLEPGHVVTIEPGVYLPGRGGVRIEDDVAVAETGSDVLTSVSRKLIRL